MVNVGFTALAKVDVTVAQGADFNAVFRYSLDDGDDVTPVDLTGYAAAAEFRDRPGAPAWLTLTDADRIELDSDGFIKIRIPHIVTSEFTGNRERKGQWDLELTSPNGDRVRFVEGAVTVSPDVTRND